MFFLVSCLTKTRTSFLQAQVDVVLPQAREVFVRALHEQEQASEANIAFSVSYFSN